MFLKQSYKYQFSVPLFRIQEKKMANSRKVIKLAYDPLNATNEVESKAVSKLYSCQVLYEASLFVSEIWRWNSAKFSARSHELTLTIR